MLDKDDPENVLKGKTLTVYIYFLKRREASGISEIQHALGFSSPSIAAHHLEKLVRLGVLSKDQFGKFILEKKVDVAILQGFANFGGLILPRFLFYAGFFLTVGIAYLTLNSDALSLLALFGTMGAVIVFFYEAWRAWKRRPF